MIKQLLLSVFLVSTAVLAYNQSERSNTKTTTEQVERISKEQFKKVIESYPEVQIIDVRTEKEFNKGSIAKAININYMDENFEARIRDLDKNKVTLVYCQAGGRSAKALQVLKKAGFVRVAELEGGYSNWD